MFEFLLALHLFLHYLVLLFQSNLIHSMTQHYLCLLIRYNLKLLKQLFEFVLYLDQLQNTLLYLNHLILSMCFHYKIQFLLFVLEFHQNIKRLFEFLIHQIRIDLCLKHHQMPMLPQVFQPLFQKLLTLCLQIKI